MGVEQGGSTLEEMGMTDKEIAATQLSPEEQAEKDRINTYNKESLETGRKNPFGRPDLIPNKYNRPSLELHRQLNKKAEEDRKESGFGG